MVPGVLYGEGEKRWRAVRGERDGISMKWILLVWFASGSNYAYIPVKVASYTTKAKCEIAGEMFVRDYFRVPRYVCLPADSD